MEFKDNYGKKHKETLSLQPVASGNSADFAIPIGNYPISDKENVSAWLQLYLDTGNLPADESYYSGYYKSR